MKIDHKKFISDYHSKSVDILFNDKRLLDALQFMKVPEKTKGAVLRAQRYINNYMSYIVWALGIIALFTPFKMIIFASIIYSGFLHYVKKAYQKKVVCLMLEDPQFFSEVTDKNLVVLAWNAHEKKNQDTSKEA